MNSKTMLRKTKMKKKVQSEGKNQTTNKVPGKKNNNNQEEL